MSAAPQKEKSDGERLLFVAVMKMAYSDWDKPVLLSPNEWHVLTAANVTTHQQAVEWLNRTQKHKGMP